MKKRLLIFGFIFLIIFVYLFIFINNNKVIFNVSSIDSNIYLDNMDVDWDSLDVFDISLNDNVLNINSEGIYIISGKSNNGGIVVNSYGNVKLILDNIDINNDNDAVIMIENAKNIIIELVDGSDNVLVCNGRNDTSKYDGCIYSKDDLILLGNGILRVNSNYLDGIGVKDNLNIESGTYIINSNGDGIHCKDSVNIVDGNFNINSVEDGIYADAKLIINNGVFNIKTSDGSGINETEKDRYYNGRMNDDVISAKAIKSRNNLIIFNGDFLIDSKGDSIHSNGSVGIVDGVFNIKSGDDAIHADKDIVIDGGKINIIKAFEGIEASNVTINNGDFNIVVSDDGINTSGNRDLFKIKNLLLGYGSIIINDGNFYINSFGDGFDSNGSIVVNGGSIYIDGPIEIGNGAFDYELFFGINGGEFIGVSSFCGYMNVSEDSKNDYVLINLPKIYEGKITLKDEDNNTIIEYNPSKEYQSVVVSNDKIDKNKIYSVYVDGNKVYG